MSEHGIIFMGTPPIAAYQLQAMVDAGLPVKAVVTIPDKPMGRGQKMASSAVKQKALELGLPVLQPEKLKDESFLQKLASFQADLFAVVAFRMLPKVVWNLPALGTINLHASLLPQYRGAAPINWVIINGESVSGATTFFIDEEIDTGRMIDRVEIPLQADETAGTLHDKIMVQGSTLLCSTIVKIFQGKAQAIEQSESAELKHAPKLTRELCEIDWSKSAPEVDRLIRGLSPYPAAFTRVYFDDDSSIQMKILFSSCADTDSTGSVGAIALDNGKALLIQTGMGKVVVTEIQPEGKRRMKVEEWLRGIRQMPVRAGK